jgi:hypothetical protein
MFNGEVGSDKRQVVIHIIHYKLEFPSKMSTACAAFVTKVLILLFLEHQQIVLVRAFFLEKEVPELTRGERTNIRKAL